MFPSHLYYNKKFDKNKHFNIISYFHSNFIKMLSHGLPSHFDAVDRKNAKKSIIQKQEGLLKKFIFFNSKVIKYLIIDIDDRNNFENMFQIYEFLADYNIVPTWILETDKGYHIGYILKNAIPYNNIKAVEYAKDTLKKLSLLLGGDSNALRLRGRFRNPLLHNTFYTLQTYDLIDISDNIPEYILNIDIQHNENKKVHKNTIKLKELVLKVLNNINYIKNIEKGYRNAFLWYLGMIIAKNFQHLPTAKKLLEFEKIKEQIYFYNRNLKEPLENEEVKNIIESIKKYYLKGKIMVGLGSYNQWTKEMKKMYIKNYRKEKGIIKNTNEERKEINKNKVLQAIYKLKKDSKKISVRKVAEVCGLSKSTVANYIKELKKDSKFKHLF